jgi:hypothetical protein
VAKMQTVVLRCQEIPQAEISVSVSVLPYLDFIAYPSLHEEQKSESVGRLAKWQYKKGT